VISLDWTLSHHEKGEKIYGVKKLYGTTKSFWAFTKVVRLKKYGKKRLVMAHETEDLSDSPRFLLSDSLHWDITRIIQTWNYRWSVEVFHEESQTNNWFGVFSGTQGGSG
jgi:hypothetical protein